ncbi:2-succinyl-6-hydroxy-2,4-cyclohexadiene-1-carboxylate synthase [Macrococcus equi]|uniref:2-succinyl-6-hydroxy-2, 4-cyclohexadiene-1-carboxylate synthase n=1 Tax=Macrococcus equi TaxID=3395462 RepID=UPI0039BE0565
MINYKIYRNNHTHLIVMIHGFLGNIETFELAKEQLLSHMDVLLVECPGHGQDMNLDEDWSFESIARHLSEKLRALQSDYDNITLYGYSMGGRLALYTALHFPELIHKLIIESATPGIESDKLRRERIEQDSNRSREIEANYEQFIDNWEALPLFQTYQPLSTEQLKRQRRIRLQHNPKVIAKALREYGTGQQPNLWPLLPKFNLPVLLLTGSLDKKFEAIAQRMCQALPQAKHVIINAGHTIHVENLEIFDTIIVSFIKEENHD